MRVLCLNCGSSSLKIALREVDQGAMTSSLIASGAIEGIGGEAELRFDQADTRKVAQRVEAPDYGAAVKAMLRLLEERAWLAGIDAVGHRVVHGGSRFTAPTVIDDAAIAAIEAISDLAPLHNGPAVEVVKSARKALGFELPQVAVFDTAFYKDLPLHVTTYAIPRDLAAKYGICRFGFHGLAHRSMLECYATLQPKAGEARVVSLQLGSGCSATASLGGRPIETSMGFTPLEGLVMGTRSGDLDPSIVSYLQQKEGFSAAEVDAVLNRRSGLFGLAGSSDMREIEQAAAAGDDAAALAIDVFCHRLVKYVGAYAAALGGLDALLFGGGIGERSVLVRRRICEAFEWLGLALDPSTNDAGLSATRRISAGGSTIESWTIQVDEEEILARDVAAAIG